METLRDILAAAADGCFPPADGRTRIVAQPSERDAGVVSFTAHSVVFTDEDPEWVRETLRAVAAESDPLSAPLHPRFLTALMDRTGRTTGTVDVLSVGSPLPGTPALPLTEVRDPDHPRAARARRHRDDVRVWTVDGGLLVLGRGVAGRMEVAVEVTEHAQHRGLGRALVRAARQLTGEPVWGQVAAGNARSLRAFQAAGYRPVGCEALLGRAGGQRKTPV
ncbi:GNAT family N-acetyltransferase [Streptomyces sp. NPDC127190]|uniref:GNAT family N-acetyltransferase n=1 Tax=unclassified Streptomyces TaxID=2593676 RepID=UPI00363E2BC5